MAIEFLSGNRLTLLNSGSEYFPCLLAAIDAANHEIFLESYIFADDETGRAVAAALCRAARRGVQVNVTVDGFGGRNFATDFLPHLNEAGVRAMLYRPEIGRWHLRRHRLRRLHRKLVIIDARLAFIGGINIIDDDNIEAGMRPRYDYAVCIAGPTLGQIHRAARHMWEIVSWANFKHRFRSGPPLTPDRENAGTQQAAFLIRDNIRHRHDIQRSYIQAIQAAHHEIVIANAYFLPGLRFGRALQVAARRGVNIVILTQGKTDHPLLRFATQALYRVLLADGIRIFEYEKSFMHAKVAVIDRHWATVGSSNIDPFSLLLAKEANLVIRDGPFAEQLHASLSTAIKEGAREIQIVELDQQPWHNHFLRWLSYALIRSLLGLSGYGPQHWPADKDNTGPRPPKEE